jgi:hypothetical protein
MLINLTKNSVINGNTQEIKMKFIVKLFISFMSIKGVSELFLDMAEYLSKQTEFTWDDRAVELFRKWSKK